MVNVLLLIKIVANWIEGNGVLLKELAHVMIWIVAQNQMENGVILLILKKAFVVYIVKIVVLKIVWSGVLQKDQILLEHVNLINLK